MANKPEEQTLTLTATNLKDIIAAAVAESRKPSELEQLELEEKKAAQEQKRAQIEQDQQTRRETAEQQLQIMANKRAFQKLCTHKHRKGDTHCTFVHDEQGGYVLCQKCQAVIRPGVAPKSYTGDVIFDTDLFNRLFQDTSSNGMWE